MLNVNGVAINFDGQNLFSNVNLQFLPGNCYGIIGANGAGKSTFLRILSGDLEPSKGEVTFDPKYRMSVLKQDHFAYEDQTIFDTIMQGNARLYEIAQEKDALYAKPDFDEEDGNRAAELEAEFSELNGWDAETEAAKLMQGLGLDSNDMYNTMSTLNQTEKVKVLLARALFGQPDMILLDEPTNGLDAKAITWLEDFLIEYEGTVIVVSHDRHFLNNVCTHIVDVDYGKIKMYVGNYDFWYESSQLMQRMMRDQSWSRMPAHSSGAFRRVSPISRRIIPPISPIRKIPSSAGSSNIPKTPPKHICAVSSAKCCSPAKTSISPCRCFPAAKRCAACSRA